jgi:hypothetical protein
VTLTRDPPWGRVANAIFAASLRLFPERVRLQHGEEMRRHFRDRCRDCAAGRISGWRLLGRELVFDSANAAVSAHLDAGVGPAGPRHATLFLLLLGAVGLLAVPDTVVAPVVTSVMRAGKLGPILAREYQQRREETVLRELANALIARPGDEDRALGAWMLAAHPARRLEFSGWRSPDWVTRTVLGGPYYEALPVQGAHARDVALAARDATSAFAIAAAAAACHPRFGCMDGALLRRLEVLDPGNAHAAFRQFKNASLAGDESGMSEALARAAAATRHDDYQDRLRRRALQAAIALNPNDDRVLMSVGRRLHDFRDSDARDWKHDLRQHCFPRGETYMKEGSFLERHPDRRADCVTVARLLSGSTNAYSRSVAARLQVALGELASEEAQRQEVASRAAEKVGWSRVQYSRDDPPGIRWTPREWADWARREVASGTR